MSEDKLEDDQQLAVEYRQWKFSQDLIKKYIQKIKYTLGVRALTSYNRADYLNCLDRFIITLQFDNFKNRNINLPLFPQNINATDPACEKLNSELFEKVNNYDGELANFLVEEIKQFHVRCDSESIADLLVPSVECKEESNGSLKMEIGESREKKLVTPCCRQLHFLVNKFGPIKTAIAVLRYEALGLRSQQWSLPKRVFELYRTEFNVKNEAFCLPLQTPFLDKSDFNFYTTFDDIDSFLGSSGNTYSLSYKEHAGGWSVNPHFINQLLKDTAEKILKVLDHENCQSYFFSVFPSWEDDEGYIMLNVSTKLQELILEGANSFVKKRMEMN